MADSFLRFEPVSDKFRHRAGILLLICLLGVYLSHLGFLPMNFENDEARRALVASEMIFSGDYITPTLNGELYFNKPPLYNWIIVASFRLLGSYSMFALRLPVILATLGMGYTVYYFLKKHIGKSVAFFTAFAYMTNGRLLIFDSFIGLIDTSFAWLTVLLFMLVWHWGEQKKYYRLFLVTYLITAACFLMKGLPAFVFQALTLLTYFTWKKQLRLLFHPAHFLGILLLAGVIGPYYYAYFSINDIAPLAVFGKLTSESSKRTVAHYGLGQTFLHFFTFPFSFLYHFAPWTILIITFFQRGVWKKIKKNPFVFYCLLIFLVNLFVYWISPEVYARYLFMFIPLIYGIWFYLFLDIAGARSWQHRFFEMLVIVMCTLLALVFLIVPFLNLPAITTAHAGAKSTGLAILFAGLAIFSIRKKAYALYVFLGAVLLVRMAFNWFAMEPRAPRLAASEQVAENIAVITEGQPLFILRNAPIGNFDAKSFQIEVRRKEVLRFSDSVRPNVFYIAGLSQIKNSSPAVYLHFNNYLSDSLVLVKYVE